MITDLIRSGGATSFVAVFNLLRGYLKGEADHQKEKPGLLKKLLPGSSKEKATEVGDNKKKNKIFVFFMTDGCDTCSDSKSIMMVIVTILMKSYFFRDLF